LPRCGPPLLSSRLTPVSKDFIAQTGDPTATGTGGESIISFLASLQSQGLGGSRPARYFTPKVAPKLKHSSLGTVSMALSPSEPRTCGSQFFITLNDGPIEYLDGRHAVFGHVVEGLEVLQKMNEAFVDGEGRPLKDIRIRHVIVLGEDRPPLFYRSKLALRLRFHPAQTTLSPIQRASSSRRPRRPGSPTRSPRSGSTTATTSLRPFRRPSSPSKLARRPPRPQP
jgi:cyclophilin family peptidyl-prolyl cis-trans isomerase